MVYLVILKLKLLHNDSVSLQTFHNVLAPLSITYFHDFFFQNHEKKTLFANWILQSHLKNITKIFLN